MREPNDAISEPSRQTPVFEDADVVVCGGGPAGVGAAVAASRRGARVALVENQTCLGGMATAGMVNRLGPYHDQEKIILGGIPWELLRILVDRALAQEPEICAPATWKTWTREEALRRHAHPYWLVFDPEGMKRALDELVTGANVSLWFDTRVVEAVMSEDRICGVAVENKSGRGAIRGNVVIDATGDGDVAARAGARFALGREADGKLQPVTLFFKCLNVDWPRAFVYMQEHGAEVRKRIEKETAHEAILVGTDNLLHREETYFNCLHEHGVDGTRTEDITRALLNLREKMWANLEVIRRHVPGCETASLIASAPALGVRESRRIRGEYELTIDDILDGRQFEDQVYRYACFVDIHEPEPGKRSPYADRSLSPGLSYGVPYRCLVPQGIENLLVAGRCLSTTHEALASVRMMPSCMAMGQAAGTAAALCGASGVPPREVSVGRLRQMLAEDGVLL
jgi:hypothetical protein